MRSSRARLFVRAGIFPKAVRILFCASDEAVLRQITMPLRIEAHLAPQDGRRADLERQTLSKLRRIMPDVQIDYISATSIGLFEQTAEHYGEVWYEMGGRRVLNRLTTPEAVLETIFEVANVKPPDRETIRCFPGILSPRRRPVLLWSFTGYGLCDGCGRIFRFQEESMKPLAFVSFLLLLLVPQQQQKTANSRWISARSRSENRPRRFSRSWGPGSSRRMVRIRS